MTRPIVVFKVGGSLLDWSGLPERLAELLAQPRWNSARPLLIAGGGAFVDVLRRLDAVHGLGDATAHALALQVLDCTARVLARVGRGARCRVVESLRMASERWSGGDVPVLAPRRELGRLARRSDGRLPESWDVTSDSIAARLSVHAGAEVLVLLKSVDLPVGATRLEAANMGLVDRHFPAVSAPLGQVLFANLRRSGPLVLQPF